MPPQPMLEAIVGFVLKFQPREKAPPPKRSGGGWGVVIAIAIVAIFAAVFFWHAYME